MWKLAGGEAGMSRRPSPYNQSEYSVYSDPPPAPAAAARGRQAAEHAHAGRRVRPKPFAFWAMVVLLTVMGVWTATTATYFAFHDDVLTGLIARQAEMQFAYEDRIAELRAQVDRMASRQLLDQEQVEHKLDAILRRQTMLEQRANTLNTLPDLGITGAIRSPGRGDRSVTKPAPINDKSTAPSAASGRKAAIGNLDSMLTRLASSLDRVE